MTDDKPKPLNEVEISTENLDGLKTIKKKVRLKGPENTKDLLKMASEELDKGGA